MKRWALLVLLLPAGLHSQPHMQPRPALAFTHVTVIDSTGAPARPDVTVVVSGNRITQLGRTGRVAVPKGAQVIPAAGKFLIPGLWDMHAHIAICANMKDTRLPLLVANGVTGIRDMGGLLSSLQAWRREISAGTLLGPRIVAAGPILDGLGSKFGPQGPTPGNLTDSVGVTINTPAEGVETVDTLKRDGVDFIKVYDRLPRATYFAIAQEAKQQAIPYAGHVPYALTAAEASDAGQKSIEHLTGMVLGESGEEEQLRRQLAGIADLNPSGAARTITLTAARALESYRPPQAERLYARLAKNGTWECPTLVVLRGSAFLDDSSVDDPDDPRLKYMAPATRKSWKDPNLGRSPEMLAAEKALYRRELAMVGELRRAGVGILAGTDMGNPYVFPGFSLHEELELLVQGGLTPLQALQTATIDAARYLGMERQLGSIEVGKLADLVLLDADPLVDIRNTRQIEAVVVDGRLIDGAKRRALLERVAEIDTGD